jgi:hypothetical protein
MGGPDDLADGFLVVEAVRLAVRKARDALGISV